MVSLRLYWAKNYTPLASRDQDVWARDWVEALREIPYLRLTKQERTLSNDNMLLLRCQMNFVGTKMEAVKADIERLWVKTLAGGLRAEHAFKEITGGFEFRFLLLSEKKEFFTGTVLVAEGR